VTNSCTRATGLAAALTALLAAVPIAHAAVEEVVVNKVGEDRIEIQRASGERWRVGLSEDCRLQLAWFQGGGLLVWSATGSMTTEARLLVPERDLTCAIAELDSLAPAKPSKSVAVEPIEGLTAMRRSLELLGYNCGPPSDSPWSTEAAQAFLRFRESKQLDASPQGIRRAVTSLALDGMRGRQPSGTSLKLARIISDYLDPLVAWLTRAGAAGTRCGAPTWIRKVAADGSLVTLADDTNWQPLTGDRALVARWQASDDVVVCSRRLVNARTGEMARAVQI
jgi:hypothetical protein